MAALNRREFICSLTAAAVAAMISSCASEAQEETPEPNAQLVLDNVKVAIAGKSKDEVMAALQEKVVGYIQRSSNCAQSTFMALRDVFNLPDSGIGRALTGFPGLGLRNETCGAVTGSMLAAGLVYGRDDIEDDAGMIRAAQVTARLGETIEGTVGSTQCGEILTAAAGRAFDFTDETDRAAYSASPEARQACFMAIMTALDTAADLLMEAAA